MIVNKLTSISNFSSSNNTEALKGLFQNLSQENIFEGKVEQVLTNGKAVVSTGNERFIAQVNTKVFEGESLLFVAKILKDSVILKILDRTFTDNKNNLLQITRLMEGISQNLSDHSKDNEINNILKSIFYLNIDGNKISEIVGKTLSEQFLKFLTNTLKHPDDILSTLVEKINIFYLQSKNKNIPLSDKELKKLLFMFLASAAKNHISSLSDNPVYSFYIPIFWQNHKTDIYISLFGKENRKQKKIENGINAVIQIVLSEKRKLSLLVHLLNNKVSYHLYSNNKNFIDFLNGNRSTLKENIEKIGIEIEKESFNIFKKDKEVIKNELLSNLSTRRVKVAV